jgi:hypothetical protein
MHLTRNCPFFERGSYLLWQDRKTRPFRGITISNKGTDPNQKKARVELYRKLDEAEEQARTCMTKVPHKKVMASIKKASADKESTYL